MCLNDCVKSCDKSLKNTLRLLTKRLYDLEIHTRNSFNNIIIQKEGPCRKAISVLASIRYCCGKVCILENYEFVTLFECLIKKNLDGLVWTIFGGVNPKVGVNHVNMVVSFVLLWSPGFFPFLTWWQCYECIIRVYWWKRLLNMCFL